MKNPINYISTISNPTKSNLSIATNIFLEILAYGGEISTTDIGLLSKKYNNVVSTHIIPRLVQNGYIKKVDKDVIIKQNDVAYDINKTKEKTYAKASYILTEAGKNALLQQNKSLFGYALENAPTFRGVSDINSRNTNQESCSALVLCEILGCKYTYNKHPHIYNEVDYDCKQYMLNSKEVIEPDYQAALENCVSNEPLAYSFRIFQNTNYYDDHIKGIQAKMFMCINKTLFFIYVLDNKLVGNRKTSLEVKNERPKKNDLLYQNKRNGKLPFNYFCSENGPYLGNAIFTIDSIYRIANVFDLKRKPRVIYDSYHNRKTVASRKNIQSIINLRYNKSYLLIRNQKNLPEHFKMIMYPYSKKRKINSLFFEESELTTLQSYYDIYYERNNYRRGIKKYGVNTKTHNYELIAPIDGFTHAGKAVFYLWELDIPKIHKAIYDNAPNGKIFCFFKDQINIIKKIFECYKINESITFNIQIKLISRFDVLAFLEENN